MSEESSTTVYAGATGFVQFDPKEREANGQTVRDVAIRAHGTQKRVYVTLWPQFAAYSVSKGDLLSVEGKFQRRQVEKDGETVEYLNISAIHLVVNGQLCKAAERDKVNTTSSGSSTSDDDPGF